MSDEQRFSDRVPYAARVVVLRGEAAWVAEVKDLSEGGCGTFRPPGCGLEVADLVLLVFFDGPGRAPVVPARVARTAPASIGFEYHDPQAVPPA